MADLWEGSGNPYPLETLDRYVALTLRIWRVMLDRVPSLGAAVSDTRACSRRCSPAAPGRARELTREHVVAFEREILAVFSCD